MHLSQPPTLLMGPHRISAVIVDSMTRRVQKKNVIWRARIADQSSTGVAERARRAGDYENWILENLLKISNALDSRLPVIIEPAKDVMAECAERGETDSTTLEAKAGIPINLKHRQGPRSSAG